MVFGKFDLLCLATLQLSTTWTVVLVRGISALQIGSCSCHLVSGRGRLGASRSSGFVSGCGDECNCPTPGEIGLGTFSVTGVNRRPGQSAPPCELEAATVTISDEPWPCATRGQSSGAIAPPSDAAECASDAIPPAQEPYPRPTQEGRESARLA